MAILRGLKGALLRQQQETDFDLETGDFNDLEIRAGNGIHYFFNKSANRLVKNFVISSGPRVDTLCAVVLVDTDDGCVPRLRFWKRDKTNNKVTLDPVDADEESILVKASVDMADHETNLWKLLNFIRLCDGLTIPDNDHAVPVVGLGDIAEALRGRDKSEILSALKLHLGGDLTDHDIQMLLDRRITLEYFGRLLAEPRFLESERVRLKVRGPEGVWQHFFESNQWIFGYGLTLISAEALSDERLEAITNGANIFEGGGKRIDAVMRTRGLIQSLMFVEIKRHDTELLASRQYRPPDVYQPSSELTGAISQVQKSAHKAIKHLEDLHRKHSREGEFEFEVSTIRPKQVVVIGHLSEFQDGDNVNTEKLASFELFRRGQSEVETITFDELHARAKFIVESGGNPPSN